VKLTAALLMRAVGCTASNAGLYAAHLEEACNTYGITTAQRLAAFLAQLGHESGSLRFTLELWGPTAAQVRYEGRADLGNTQPGDGRRFCGRGLIQTTGRSNYARVSQRLASALAGEQVPDFVATPDALEQPRWAAMSAADYWDEHGLNALADRGEFESITRRINGGLNGQADRLARWGKAKQALAGVEIQSAVPPKEKPMFPAILAAVLPSLIESIPKLGKLFGSGSEVAERNVRAAEIAVTIAQEAIGASNAQDTIERLKADPAAAAAAAAAVESRWFELVESGGGGIDGARKADAVAVASGESVLRSPSFWMALLLAPLAYMVTAGVVFNLGGEWSQEIRASVASAVLTMTIGAIGAYYFGSATRNNRGAPPPSQ
jgi:putative chitinase